jgi:DNA-binding NarL/FixJ family response regulator
MKKKCKIVIIDDHPVFLSVLGELLKQQLGFLVVGLSRSGEEGLEICGRTKPDLVLVDMMMPGMSGLEVIKFLRKQDPDVLLLAISGLITKELICSAFMAGVSGYFSKSRSTEELLDKLRAMSEGDTEMTLEEAEALRWAVRERRLRSDISMKDLQLLRLYSDDLPIKEIAQRTGRTVSSTYKAFRRIRQQLDAKTDWDLRLIARRFGLAAYKEIPE